MDKKITTKSLYGSHESFKSHHSNAIKTNASNIAANTTDITSIQTALSTKQNELTNTTDVSINELSVGNTPITPGSNVVYPFQIRQPFLSSPDPQNGFGVGMLFRYPKGGGSTDVVDMSSIASYFKSDGDTQTPYTGMKFTGLDGGGIRTLFNVYHKSLQGDGESTMEVGNYPGNGLLKVQNIELDGTNLGTTLSGKQDTITTSTVLNIDTVTAEIITLDGADLATTLTNKQTSITSSTVINTGILTAEPLLSRVASGAVSGYGFWRYEGASPGANMNLTSRANVAWTEKYVDSTFYGFDGNSGRIKVKAAGYYQIGFNVYLTSTVTRCNPSIRIYIDGLATGYLAWSYIRGGYNHNESNWNLSPVIMEIDLDSIIEISGTYSANGASGTVSLYNNTGTQTRCHSTLTIKKIA